MSNLFWKRLIKIGVFTIAIYLVIGFALLFTTIVRNELIILGGRSAIPVISTDQRSEIHTYIRNVFGDPLPHAVAYVAGRVGQADNKGLLEMSGLVPGRYELEIFVGDYQPYMRDVVLEEGMNSPVIKYDTGLWPAGFLVDFHIFYGEQREIFGLLSFANGTSESIYINKATLYDKHGEVVLDLLHDSDGFTYYANISSMIEIETIPQVALKWPAKMWQPGEFTPIPGIFDPGLYTVEVHYGNFQQHQEGSYQTIKITDFLDMENNRDPHLPVRN